MYDRTIQMRKQNRHKVKRNRAALDVKRGFELRYKKSFRESIIQKCLSKKSTQPIHFDSGFFPVSIKAKLKDIAYSGFRSYNRPNALYIRRKN